MNSKQKFLWILGFAFCGLPAYTGAQEIKSQQTIAEFPGIKVITGSTNYTEFHAATIDLCADGVSMNATTIGDSCETAHSWGSSQGAKVVINGDYWNVTQGCPCAHGPAVGQSSAWPNNKMNCDPKYLAGDGPVSSGWIAFGNNWVEFSHSAQVKQNPSIYNATQGFRPNEVTSELPEGTIALVSGYSELVTEGVVNDCSKDTLVCELCWCDRADLRDKNSPRHRTAMGISQDRKTFFMLVADSPGASGLQMARLIGELGAWQAFELDGGGSSQMWVEGKGLISLNEGGATARAVANHWGAFSATGPAVSCYSPQQEPVATDGSDGGGDVLSESNTPPEIATESPADGGSDLISEQTNGDTDSSGGCGCQSSLTSSLNLEACGWIMILFAALVSRFRS